MKNSGSFLIHAAAFLLLTSTIFAEPVPPTFRETPEWLIFSGFESQPEATIPWTHAIRKKSITSVSITVDTWAKIPKNSDDKPLLNLTPEALQKFPSSIVITTDERSDGGANKRYYIHGLTHGSAPALLDKILESIK